MRLPPSILLLGSLLNTPALCEPAMGALPQLHQLNRASQQELRNIQDAAGETGTVESSNQSTQVEQLNRRQHTEQQLLQEGQRREVLVEKQRAKTAPATGIPYRLQAIDRQTQFRLQQQNQLNRFRLQQGTGTR